MPILDIESPIYILGMEVDGPAKNMAAFHDLANIVQVSFAVEGHTGLVRVNRHVSVDPMQVELHNRLISTKA